MSIENFTTAGLLAKFNPYLSGASLRTAFLITIDTEGDNLWASPREITTRNVKYLPRFQALCEKYALKPTYLTNYEMVSDEAYCDFARDVLARGQGEVGTHIHAWNSPPVEYSITEDDYYHSTYLIEYPEPVMREKLAFMTDYIEKTFGIRPVSHRAGRWAMDKNYVKLLLEYGYKVDCSVTPHVSWRAHRGNPKGQGGTDYRHYPEHAYWITPENMDKPGTSSLLELPMTIRTAHSWLRNRIPHALYKNRLSNLAIGKILPVHWFRPKLGNKHDMLALLARAEKEQWPYIEFMIHSSEFMPGGSPYFRSSPHIESLFSDMEAVFSAAQKFCDGMTLREYYEKVRASDAPMALGTYAA